MLSWLGSSAGMRHLNYNTQLARKLCWNALAVYIAMLSWLGNSAVCELGPIVTTGPVADGGATNFPVQ